ncbi:MAG: A/G-specific adenine glycosylase [Cyanobacteria bacterium SBC]|nr:A/G-specific adenine glycosylase [Cyanobacteria bacterium SBC]
MSPSPENIQWFRRRLSQWSTANLRDFPWRNTHDPYKILIAESLLQKTTAEAVLPIYSIFLDRYPNPKTLSSASLSDLATLLKPLGLLFRAKRILEAIQVILKDYCGCVPDTEKDLLKLPGIGQYSARSILAHAFSKSAAVLDTNVARIFERFFGIEGERVKSRCKKLWGLADRIVPKQNASRWNLTLLDFGALVCTARNPKCDACPLCKRCAFLSVE